MLSDLKYFRKDRQLSLMHSNAAYLKGKQYYCYYNQKPEETYGRPAKIKVKNVG